MAASDLKSVKLTPANHQICEQLPRGLDELWKPIRDHLVYSPKEVSLDDAIGALEAHEQKQNQDLAAITVAEEAIILLKSFG
ncbi:uncharacterized protein PGTG_21255 [Puccinia graminis f. sp. tritici CRL 75-36-700-3]|uniref:Uncharacterized protein n=1 Tax=Puccinia graminis f. sp. tritici (strain CRL 75-36-700-3 / race SCCL) TaxID=418459 RepID=H6QQV4_PUCGT|nr:uncharacterized protein PGTG_21255 [Puccinia graminis f. sp. tritici CRL 75-36-700-3]EHS62883.1 hypothetical protein PGTG_21255 [Puccinia graminis f. sp. tritici CRL 75-36-700-3]